MKPFYQTEWQGIQFSEFTTLSDTELAGADFYNAFYREFFTRNKGYDDLDAAWRQKKDELTEWLAGHVGPGARVLSLGCGLGYMEAQLHRRYGDRIELHVSDYASDALRWLRQVLPAERFHTVGDVDGHKPYDLIYLSAVDYALSAPALMHLVADQRALLTPTGTCILISASYIEESESLALRSRTQLKNVVKAALRATKLDRRDRGQFWGWLRTRSEYRALIRAGYSRTEDGFVETPHQRTYFIKALR